MATNPRLIEMAGKRFGRWLVVEKAGNTTRGGAVWHCACDCGARGEVPGGDLRSGKSLSCGCAGSRATLRERATTHGATGTPLYVCWKNMRARCSDPSRKDYCGKGVTVCAEWDSFETFSAWASGAGYRPELTIERRDSKGHYEPGNCTWADRTTQNRNRSIVRLAPDGRTWAEIAESNGISVAVMNNRISSGGWSPEDAATHRLGIKRIHLERLENGQFAPQPSTWRR